MSQIIEDILALCGGARAEWRETFNPGRYPYTYAYDYVRERTHDDNSRADVAGIITRYCQETGRDKETVCVILADAYVDARHIDAPRLLRADALAQKQRAIADAAASIRV